jgi:predicted protein tyrosine phosphatase
VDDIVNDGFERKTLPVELAPYLLLGGIAEAQDVDLLAKLNCTHVLNMACGAGTIRTGPDFYGDDVEYLEVDADDLPAYELIEPHFEACHAFLASCRQRNGRLFIHCMAGINRSGAMGIALYMVAEATDLLSAVRHCHALRGPICWNQGFQLQLVQFARARSLLSPRTADDEGEEAVAERDA